MLTDEKDMCIASANGKYIGLAPALGNRHGLVAGATGTGKTITLQTMVENFSALGTPVFLTDVKGDLAGLSQPGQPGGSIAARIDELHLRDKGYANQAYPVCFWDVLGKQGHPLRSTTSSMGPLLFSRLLNLTEVQSGVLHIVFRIADDRGLLLLDFKDLRSMVAYVGENSGEFQRTYGNIAPASIGAIQRGLLRLEEEGGNLFFGEPSLRIEDLLMYDLKGRGMINILQADSLMSKPRMYSAVLLWLLSSLFEQLPEVGDLEKPRLVLMFDEAHLLFTDMPSVLREKIAQVVRLIRSKGVGVYFITQNPADVPGEVLTQLGNKVQHALRAFTPQDQKAVRAAAQSFRENPAFKTEEAITNLVIGEALVSFLDTKGKPAMVEKAFILPPESLIGGITEVQRRAVIQSSRLAGRYDTVVDRESAYEMLAAHFSKQQEEAKAASQAKEDAKRAKEETARQKEAERLAKQEAKKNPNIVGGVMKSVTTQVTRTLTNTIGREVGKSILRGILGGFK
jgi:DNA helicase HerA-like ATPase